MSLVGSLRGVQASPEPCNSNSNSIGKATALHSDGSAVWLSGEPLKHIVPWGGS
jgi:hypothetical protein